MSAVNDAPVISSSAVTNATEDASYSYTFTSSDEDGDVLTISGTTPGWLTLTDNGNGTATLSGTPLNTNVGDTSVVLIVTDGSLQDSQTFIITVANTNDTPELVSITAPDAVLEDGDNITITISPTDVDAGESLTVSVTANNSE